MVLLEYPSFRNLPYAAACIALVSAAPLSWADQPQTKPRTKPETTEQIEFDTTLRLSRVLTMPGMKSAAKTEGTPDRILDEVPVIDLVGRPGLPGSIMFETDLIPAYRLMAELPEENTEFSFLREQNTGFDPIRIRYERQTALVDGGFGDPPESDEAASSFYESPGERFDRYSLSLEWTPAGADAELQWLLIGGLHAIRADIGRLDPENASLGLTEARGMVAIPTVGTGFRWKPTDSFSFSTTAATQSIEQNASMLEVIFSAQIHFSQLVGLTAGYEFYRSDMVIEDLKTSLDREGVFARLTIRF